jgi:signal transduction histidine kinase
MKRDFVAKVSHDLKTPLSSMQETTSAVLDGVAGPVSDIQRQLLALNLESSQRLSGMLSKLLDLSRLEARLEPAREIVDVRAVVSRALGLRSAVPTQNGPRVVVVEPSSPWIVRGDAQALGQVIDNLIENALKFSPPGGTVTVRGERHQGALLLSVADEGPGIPDAEKERVFERFYQTETGRAVRGRGAGLGLAICREIVTAHGGRIWVSNNDPRGSVLQMILPAEAAEPLIEVAA